LKDVTNYQCPNCAVVASPGGTVEAVESAVDIDSLAIYGPSLDEGKMEHVDKFCYRSHMISAGGGAGESSKMKVKFAWNKFRELQPILTKRGASQKMKGKIYRACVQSVLVYGTEIWAMKVDDMERLERTERMMVRWMCCEPACR